MCGVYLYLDSPIPSARIAFPCLCIRTIVVIMNNQFPLIMNKVSMINQEVDDSKKFLVMPRKQDMDFLFTGSNSA